MDNKRIYKKSFRMNEAEYQIFRENVNASGLSETAYIVSSCTESYKSQNWYGNLCSIIREIDILEEKIHSNKFIRVEDLNGLREAVCKEWTR